MKKLSTIDLDLMEKELPILDQSSIESIKGGYDNNKYGCVFNCLEYIGKTWGMSNDHDYYYGSFKENFDYDPAKAVRKRVYTNTNDYVIVEQYGIRNLDDMRLFFDQSNFQYNEMTTINNSNLNGSQMAYIKPTPENGIQSSTNHAVIPLSVDTAAQTLTYYDPTANQRRTVSINDVAGVYDMGPKINVDSGFVDSKPYYGSGIFGSGYYDNNSGYYA